MTPSDFQVSLDALSELFELGGSPSAARDLRRLTAIFAASKEKTVAATLKKLSKLRIESGSQIDAKSNLRELLKAATNFAQKTAQKYAKTLEILVIFIESYSGVSTDFLVQAAIAKLEAPVAPVNEAPRETIVHGYVKRLEEALGHESFAIVHKQLSEDDSVTAGEVVAIAKAFTPKN